MHDICLPGLDKVVLIKFSKLVYIHMRSLMNYWLGEKREVGGVGVFVAEDGCFLLKQQQMPVRLLCPSASSLAHSLHVVLTLSLRVLKPNGKWPLAGCTVFNTVGHCRRNMLAAFSKTRWPVTQTAFWNVLPSSCASFGKVTLRYAQSFSGEGKPGVFWCHKNTDFDKRA